jgi:hypothetical protein
VPNFFSKSFSYNSGIFGVVIHAVLTFHFFYLLLLEYVQIEGEKLKVSLLKQKKTNVSVAVILCIAAVVFLSFFPAPVRVETWLGCFHVEFIAFYMHALRRILVGNILFGSVAG